MRKSLPVAAVQRFVGLRPHLGHHRVNKFDRFLRDKFTVFEASQYAFDKWSTHRSIHPSYLFHTH